MREFAVVQYHLFGLSLQEPIALFYNWLIFVLCMIWVSKLKPVNEAVKNWRWFFILFGIACLFGGFAHSLYQYFGNVGKIPQWILGIVSGFFAGKAMWSLLPDSNKFKRFLFIFLWLKMIVNLTLCLSFMSFTFVTIDSILTYFIYAGGIGFYLYKKGQKELRYFFIAVLCCLPAAFIFLLKIDLSKYFNREDLSHVFILLCLIFFHIGTKKLMKR